MLVEGFYSVLDKEISENEISVSIILNPDHPVYKGHFPGQPVVPGVMILQIVKEIIESLNGSSMEITNIKQIKYFVPLLPEDNTNLKLKIKYSKNDDFGVKYLLSSGDIKFSQGSFQLEKKF